MFRTLIGFALPIASMIFLVVGPLLGWERHKKKMELARSNRAKSHSLERARLVATNHKRTNTIRLTGVLNLDSTVLIGYTRDFPTDGRLAPGEKVNDSGSVIGTWVAFSDLIDTGHISQLSDWTKAEVDLVFTVDDASAKLHFVEPISQMQVSLQLTPSI
ncbi:MAG: hypothetical protein M0019_09885 [Actinomycetota bacterium]|nr:hypothetical protein [Actinomycetota bacterium]